PCIALVACSLLDHSEVALEILVRPPSDAGTIAVDGFGKELVAIQGKRGGVDRAGFEWPEAPAAGLVAKIGIAVCRADKDALRRLYHFAAAVAWPVPLVRA